METVNNLTSAASRAIWGDPNKTTETGEEPAPGETGDVSAGEPYDKGNLELTSTPESTNPKTSSATGTKEISSSMPIRSKDEASASHPTSSTDTAAEGSDEHSRIEAAKKETEDAAKVIISGPGPKPLPGVMKDGGSAGRGGEEDGPQKESHDEGTGEKYTKSSGVKADGGNFDAANAGAANEADRLLETKGIHHETSRSKRKEPTDASSKTDAKDTMESGGKISLKEKIKAKLHKNKVF